MVNDNDDFLSNMSIASINSELSAIKLSICIATYKRARFIGETLDSILNQLCDGVELLIVDGASPDDTEKVVLSKIRAEPRARYIRQNVNSGIDGDYDYAVSYARGEYCWLMTDDDLMTSDAIQVILNAIEQGHDLVIPNSQIFNSDYSSVISEHFVEIQENKIFRAADQNALMAEAAHALSFIGCVVIRRSLWLERTREIYFGTLFVHVGVIFQKELGNGALLLAQPLILIRYGNAMWTPRGFEIWMFKWPDLIWSFDRIGAESMATVTPRKPWLNFRILMRYRAIGGYGIKEFELYLAKESSRAYGALALFLAILPESFVNFLCGLYCLVFARNARANIYDLSRAANATWISRLASRIVGLSH